MRKFTKGESLDILRANNMNTPIYRVFKYPFNREMMISAIADFPDKISIRTYRTNEVECPFFPNKSKSEIADILDSLFEDQEEKPLDEIILSQGIDPEFSWVCGRISHLDSLVTEDYAYLEYFSGKGTVRDLDKKPSSDTTTKAIPRWGFKSSLPWELHLINKCRIFFQSYPWTTLEWSIYPYGVGEKQENLIFWEVL